MPPSHLTCLKPCSDSLRNAAVRAAVTKRLAVHVVRQHREVVTHVLDGMGVVVDCPAGHSGAERINACTKGSSRSAWATTMPATRKTKPIRTSQSRSNHFDLPTRSMGAVPHWFGSEPDQVFGSTASSAPVDSCRRNSSSESGVILDVRGAGWRAPPASPGAGSSVTMRPDVNCRGTCPPESLGPAR